MRQIVLLIFLFSTIFLAQTGKTDPLRGNYNLGSSSEIVMFWQNGNDAQHKVKHQIIDYYGTSGQYFLDTANRGSFLADSNNAYDENKKDYFDVITGDFDGDGLDEIISAWETANNSINIVIPQNIDKTNLSWNEDYVLKLENILYPDPNFFRAVRCRLIKGSFDGDVEPEFAIAFWNQEGKIEIRVFDVNPNTLEPTEMATITDVFIDPTLNNAGIYDIAAGDFDGDFRDEFVLVTYHERDDNDWSMNVRVYDYIENNGSFTIVPKAEKENYFSHNDFFDPWHRINSLTIETGDFKNNTLDEFVVNFVLYRNDSETYNKMLPAYVTTNLDTINVDLDNLKDIFQTLGQSFVNIGLLTGDINNDGKDEIIIDGDGRIRIYDIDTTLSIQGYVAEGQGTYHDNNRRMFLADLDASTSDSVWNPELIVTSTSYRQPDNSNNYTTITVHVFEPQVDGSGDIISLNERTEITIDSTDGSRNYHWAITAGDFDGGGIQLGTPNYYSATDIVQPLVILNAPPVHFDMLDNTIFDVNRNFNGQVSDFYSTYYTSSETDIEVETEVHTGWTIGGSVSGGFKIPIVKVGVEVKIEGEYGRDFSKRTTTSNTYRVSQNITASSDDYLYATIIDYDIWEYPVLADDEVQGHVLVVEPGKPQRSWFPSKSPQATDYIPDHEVGNILSYNEITSPNDNSGLQQVLKWNTSDQITLDGSPGFEFNWALENETQTEVSETNEVHWNVSASASFDIPFKYIPNFELNGDYSSETISTRRNRVTYKKGLDVHLGPIDLGIGETYYSVTPYAYWAKSGALVLDYAVDPRPSGINVPETWWQTMYSGKPDPALTLPWRLDPEKGFSITEDKRQQTKEILFYPEKPKPGETISVKTRIHNYSLLNTSSSVDVSFYIGDPNNGGTLIESTDGKTIFSTDDFIEARESKIISFNWQLPSTLETFPRIYVVLDPENKIDEIHESNNIGWKVLPLFDTATDIIDSENLPTKFELSQNYPNPFNPTTTISYTIALSAKSEKANVKLAVYDILGREVRTLVNKVQKPGNYEVTFDAKNISNGVYFYKFQAGNFIRTKKMLLLK